MIKNEQEFYFYLLKAIDQDMISKGLKNPNSLISEDTDYLISRTQYFNIKRLSQGKTETPRLSLVRLKSLCKELGIKVDPLFKVEKLKS